MKNKKIFTFVICIIMVVNILLFKKVNMINVNAEDTNIAIIQNTTMNKYGEIFLINEDHGYSELFGESLLEYRDENYVYLINPSSEYIKAIMLSEKKNNPLFEYIDSFEEAENNAKIVAQRACNNFFSLDYDIFSNFTGENDKKIYSIELWEKISDDFYTGNKIAIVLTADGYLDSLIVRSEEAIIDTYTTNDYILEKEAIKKAYEEISLTIKNREQAALSNIQEEDQEIISDAALLGVSKNTNYKEETKDYNINSKEEHVVNTYKQFEDGIVEWVIMIENVQTNTDLGNMKFRVKVNALTGETISITSTR